MKIYALHGFLGLPSDWDSIFCDIRGVADVVPVDILRGGTSGTMDEWAKAFNASVRGLPGKKKIVGYSMGGRLALHVLRDAPEIWDGGTIISAHPGIVSAESRVLRLEEDRIWAQRFLSDPWELLMKDWEGRGVFKESQGQGSFVREEVNYDREILSKVHENWSVAFQDDFRPWLKDAQIPIVWVTGQKDVIYKELSRTLVFGHPSSQKISVAGAGHRVPWDV